MISQVEEGGKVAVDAQSKGQGCVERFLKGRDSGDTQKNEKAEFTSRRREGKHVRSRKSSPDRGPEMSRTSGTVGMTQR